MKLPSVGLPLNASKLESMLNAVFVFRPMRPGTNVNGFDLVSHVPCFPLKGSVLSAVRIVGRGNPGQTIQLNLGIVGAERGLCASIH